MDDDIRIRQVTRGDDPAIAAFGRMQRRVYFDPSMLIPAPYIAAMLGREDDDDAPRRNFLLVAETASAEVVGGVLFHLLQPVGTGFSSFMGVAPEARGRGLARRMHDARFAALDAAAGVTVPALFIDVSSPTRETAEEREQEAAAGFDAVSRRGVFERLGFRRVGVQYEQPVGGPDGGPVTTMDLLVCLRDASRTTIESSLVLETMRAYWTPWLGADRAAVAVERLRSRGADGPLVDLHPATS
ncbi:MAG: GNAT family N-acetyltransferase [Planctomycetota bacterium]